MSQQTQKAQGLPNPYAPSLPNPYATATAASSAPVKFSDEQVKAEQKKPAFHNPHTIKRPQAKKAAVIKKPVLSVAGSGSGSVSAADALPPAEIQQQPQQPQHQHQHHQHQHNIDYYRSTADDDAAIMEEQRRRNYEDMQRKKAMKKFHKQFGYWNAQAPYKPERWSNLKAYRASGGWQRTKEGFGDFLLGFANHEARSYEGSEVDDALQSTPASRSPGPAVQPAFVEPASNDFPPAPVSRPLDETAEDAYARRVAASQQAQNQLPTSTPARAFPPPPSVADDEPAPAPAPAPTPVTTAYHSPPATTYNSSPMTTYPTAQNTAYQGATISAPPVRYANATISAPPVRYDNATISAPPVHYERPNAQQDNGQEQEEDRPAKKPKMSKAEAMMAKMGYVKGQGLGKNNDGVLSHLEVKIRKQTQGASTLDDEGGKIKSQQVFDIRGGHRKKEEPGEFGEESSVVVAWGCIDGLDWAANAERDDGGIRQDMGEIFSKKFGPVERIQLDENNPSGAVYIHFTSILSALNAVNRFSEGWQFRDRTIRARYYDERKFHAGILEH